MTLQSFYAFYIKCLQTKVQEELKRFLEQFIIFRSLEEVCSKKLHENKYLKIHSTKRNHFYDLLYFRKGRVKKTPVSSFLRFIQLKKYYLTYCINFLAVLQALKRNPSSSDDDGIRTINDVASSQNVYGTKVPFHWNFYICCIKRALKFL